MGTGRFAQRHAEPRNLLIATGALALVEISETVGWAIRMAGLDLLETQQTLNSELRARVLRSTIKPLSVTPLRAGSKLLKSPRSWCQKWGGTREPPFRIHRRGRGRLIDLNLVMRRPKMDETAMSRPAENPLFDETSTSVWRLRYIRA